MENETRKLIFAQSRCLENMCKFNKKLCHYKDLVLHLQKNHGMKFKNILFLFRSMEEFNVWKAKLEKGSNCLYQIIERNLPLEKGEVIVFRCDGRSTSSGVTKSNNKETTENEDNRGSCTSIITLTAKNDLIYVELQQPHYGHDCENSENLFFTPNKRNINSPLNIFQNSRSSNTSRIAGVPKCISTSSRMEYNSRRDKGDSDNLVTAKRKKENNINSPLNSLNISQDISNTSRIAEVPKCNSTSSGIKYYSLRANTRRDYYEDDSENLFTPKKKKGNNINYPLNNLNISQGGRSSNTSRIAEEISISTSSGIDNWLRAYKLPSAILVEDDSDLITSSKDFEIEKDCEIQETEKERVISNEISEEIQLEVMTNTVFTANSVELVSNQTRQQEESSNILTNEILILNDVTDYY